MTRMLCSILTCLILIFSLGGCSLFSDEESGPVSNVDTESVSGGEFGDGNLLDAEDEMLAESSDLLDDSQAVETDEFSDEPLEPSGQESLDSEFDAAELDAPPGETEVAGADDGFGDDDFGADFGDDLGDEDFEVSATDAGGIDKELADDEFSEFDEAGNDEFALDAQPVAEEAFGEEPPLDDIAVSADEAPLTPLDGQLQITNLAYKSFENGGTVVIETTAPAVYEKYNDPALNQVIIEVQDAFLPQRFKRPYITKDFKQDIATINAYSDPSGSARFVIQLKRPMDPVVQQEGNSILVMTQEGTGMSVADSGSAEQPLDALVSENEMDVPDEMSFKASTRPSGSGGASYSGANTATDKNSSVFTMTEKSGLSLNDGRFVGENISLEFDDHDIRDIIEVIAEKSGVNLIMDKEVSGNTSILLRDVPWDQALLVLLRSQGLGYVRQGTVLRIAKQSTLSSEAQAVSSQIKNEKEANRLSGGIKVKYIPVSYADVKSLSTKLKDFTSKEGKIAFDDRTSSLVITDYGEYIERVIELVRALDTPPMQVEIESKLIEAREEFSREAGINWSILGQQFPVNSQNGQFNAAFSSSLPSNGLSLDLNIGTFDIFGDLEASLNIFEQQNKIKVLSQPRVVTMNKVQAEIVQNTQIPFDQLVQNPGAPPIITPAFQDLLLSLKVTPQITFKGDVILDVEVRREFPGAEGSDGRRELNKRKAKTTVMVKNGKTAVIGGIYQLDDTDIDTGIPLLKDIPLIGYLFKQVSVQKSKNELLLFLKPKILKEIEGPQVSKSVMQDANYDPFEELTVDEGNQPQIKIDAEGGDEDLNFDDLEDPAFEEDGETLSL